MEEKEGREMKYLKYEEFGNVFLFRDEPSEQSWDWKNKLWHRTSQAYDAFNWGLDHPTEEITKEEAEEIAGVKFED